MMHTVPKELRGATLGAAHKWVRTQTDAREYALKNPSGETISLAELTNGSVVEVEIVGGPKKNPAHPATFTARDYGINNRVNLTHILPEEVSPALVSSLVQDHGLFGAVQSLSMLMSRPLKEDYPVSAAAEEILRARAYTVEGSTLALRNPAPYGFGRSYGGRFLGQEIAAEDEAMRKYVEENITNKLENISLTEGEAKNFVNNSLAPFLLAAEANRQAVAYIRQYILPAAKKFGLRKGSLDREFDYMVKHMATDPADFYYGKEFAILAHPGFLFPQFGTVAFPVPSNSRDTVALARINDLFLNAGNPPKFAGNKFVRREAEARKMRDAKNADAVKFLNQRISTPADSAPISWDFIKERLKKFDLAAIIRSVALSTQQVEEKYTSDTGAFVEAFKTLSTKERNEVLKQTFEQSPEVLFVMDLQGMRPRPHDWPDKLVLSTMEVFAQNRVNVEPVDMLKESFSAGGGLGTVEVEGQEVNLDQAVEAFEDDEKLAKALGLSADEAAQATARFAKAMQQASKRGIVLKDLTLPKSKASLGDMMVSAVSLAITKHGYEASGEDIKFTTVLMVYALQNLGAATGHMELNSLAADFAGILDRNRARNTGYITRKINELTETSPRSFQSLIALKAMEKALEGMSE